MYRMIAEERRELVEQAFAKYYLGTDPWFLKHDEGYWGSCTSEGVFRFNLDHEYGQYLARAMADDTRLEKRRDEDWLKDVPKAWTCTQSVPPMQALYTMTADEPDLGIAALAILLTGVGVYDKAVLGGYRLGLPVGFVDAAAKLWPVAHMAYTETRGIFLPIETEDNELLVAVTYLEDPSKLDAVFLPGDPLAKLTKYMIDTLAAPEHTEEWHGLWG